MFRNNHVVELIEKSGIFDAEWYLALYPDVRRSNTDPFAHYTSSGYKEERSPHPLFWPSFYLAEYPDVAESKTPSIYHYLNSGGREWRMPCPLIDRDRYFESYSGHVANTVTGTLLEDFVKANDRPRGLSFFDSKLYIENAGLKDASFNAALMHFFRKGLAQGVDPHPLLQMDLITEAEDLLTRLHDLGRVFSGSEGMNIRTHPFIDVNFFRRKYPNSPHNPAIQYLRNWKFQSVWVNPLFDSDYYRRSQNLEKDDICPITHYLTIGAEKDLKPNAYFDPAFYRSLYEEKFEKDQTPLEHYMKYGHLEWFNPGPQFGQKFYFTRHRELEKRGIPLLEHFLHTGRFEGESPTPPAPFFDDTKGMSTDDLIALIREQKPLSGTPEVSVVIPVYKNVDYTLRCVLSLLRSRDKTAFDIHIADDKSPDESGETLAKAFDGLDGVHMHVNEENLGFLQNCNAAVARTEAPFVFLLNNDTVVLDGWLDEALAVFKREKNVGLVGSKLVYPNGLLQEAGGIIWDAGSAANYGRYDDPAAPQYSFQRDTDYISGAAILLSRDSWNAVNGFSEELAPAYYEDTDIAMKLRRAGLRCIYQPLSTVVHFEGISSGTSTKTGIKRFQEINHEKFLETWKDDLAVMGKHGDFTREVVDRYVKGRILIFDAEVPKPDKDSGSITAYFYMKILSELGYRVTFVPENLAREGRYTVALQRLGVEVIHGPYVTNARKYVLDHGEDFDLFILSRATTGGQFFNELKAAFPEKPFVFDTVDLHHLRLMRQFELTGDMAFLEDAQQLKHVEYNTIRQSDATILVSEYEVDYLRSELGPFPHMVIPLIYEDYERTKDFEQRRDIAFVGGYRHPPNIDAVKHLVENIWPQFREYETGATLHIIGSHMPPDFADYADEDINIVGFVDDLEAYLDRIRFTVAPLRYGAGVKGKVGNSLRMGVPVVGTPVATEGMNLIDEETVLIGTDARSFSEKMHRLYTDGALWQQLSDNGQAFVRANFGISPVREKLRRLCEGIIRK